MLDALKETKLTYGGDIKYFPIEVVEKMLYYQVQQGNKRDISVFENKWTTPKTHGGVDWNKTHDGFSFWYNVIELKNFDWFFIKYPKKQDTFEEKTAIEMFKEMSNEKGVKETTGKLDYSEINLSILDLMAQRFMDNKHKYPKGNSKKPLDVKELEWAIFRHIRKIIKPIKNDNETYKDHLAAIANNVSMILDQLELQENLNSN